MKRLLSLLFAAALLIPGTCASAEETASDMRLEASRGTVTVTDGEDKAVTVRDGMKLFDGYSLSTGAESCAWISLDAAKALKLDAGSRARVNRAGDKLVIDLEEGDLPIDVSVPLRDDETLDIRTSTTITGVRGTVLIVRVLGDGSTEVYVLEGSVDMTATDPETGETETVTVKAGQIATSSPQDGGNKVSIRQFSADEVGGFVLEEIEKDPALAARLGQSDSPEVRKLLGRPDQGAGDPVLPGTTQVRLVLTTGSAAEVEQLMVALESCPSLVADVSGVEAFLPDAAVELGAGQTLRLTITDFDMEQNDLTNAGTVIIGSGSSIETGGGVSNSGVISITGMLDAAFLTNESGGVINIYGVLVSDSSLNNSGVINVYNGGSIQILGEASNDGVINVLAGGTLEVTAPSASLDNGSTGEIVNDGSIVVGPGSELSNDGDITNNGSGEIVNDGDIDNGNSGVITNDGVITNNGTIANGGTIDGSGEIDGDAPIS